MAHIIRTSFHQDANVGTHGFANNRFCLMPSMVPEQIVKEISGILKVQVHLLNLCGTSLNGIFAAGNNHCVLLPNIVFDSELAVLKKLKINYHILDTEFTALGNNLVATDNACLISPDLEPLKAEIKKALNVKKIQSATITGLPIVGSLIVLNDKGCLLSAMATEEEARFVEDFFGVPVTRGTVNLGTPYVSTGIIVNKHGLVIGDRTGGPEAVNIDEALGFLGK